MNQPTPAIVSQEGVRRLPRWGLLLFCAFYVIAGFVGRDPWKRVDMTSFGYMLEMAHGKSSWLTPGLLGEVADFQSLLPYWLGAVAIQVTPAGADPFLLVRLAYMLLLCLTLAAVWYGIYYLARSPQAQPVSFAFGGEARPVDYARTIADGGLLAFMACMGLAQMGHEVSPALAQLCFAAWVLFGLAALPYRTWTAALFGTLGLAGLTLSGAPVLAVLFGLLGIAVHALRGADWQEQASRDTDYELGEDQLRHIHRMRWRWIMGLGVAVLACIALASVLHVWRWRLEHPPVRWVEWRNLVRMHLWFTWPVWPLVLWTLWRWRHQWGGLVPSRHIALPVGMAMPCVVGTVVAERPDALLLPALPALAALAAFALPTFKRSASAFIDWFTLIFFSVGGAYLWFMWIAMQTGAPAAAARRVATRLPGYEAVFDWWPLLGGLAGTIGWMVMVRWRTKRLRPAIWKSMILPAGGVTLCWVLLNTLWLPALNYARSYVPQSRTIATVIASGGKTDNCAIVYGLEDAQIAALQYHGGLKLTRERTARCQWLLVDAESVPILQHAVDLRAWQLQHVVDRSGDRGESIHVFMRR